MSAMDEGPINLLKPREDDFIFKQSDDKEFLFRPGYKEVASLDFGNMVGGLKGVTDFDAYENVNKQK